MCDLLKKSALAYQKLSACQYTLLCDKKGVLTQVIIRFPVDAYHHLAGFQYARIAALRERKTALQVILAGDVTHQQLMSSGFQHEDRLRCLISLSECLEANRFVFRYNGHEHPGSSIKADYLMQFEDAVFFTCKEVPVSIFSSPAMDYGRNCPRMTVLEIRRLCLETGNEEVVYQRTQK